MYVAIVPSGGISQSSGAPTASGSAATVYRIDPGGTVKALGSFTLYNVSTQEAVPQSALATLDVSEGGKFYARSWDGQAKPAAVVHGPTSPGHRGF
jgi:hypothetical protein